MVFNFSWNLFHSRPPPITVCLKNDFSSKYSNFTAMICHDLKTADYGTSLSTTHNIPCSDLEFFSVLGKIENLWCDQCDVDWTLFFHIWDIIRFWNMLYYVEARCKFSLLSYIIIGSVWDFGATADTITIKEFGRSIILCI